jgi:hypothetical protein
MSKACSVVLAAATAGACLLTPGTAAATDELITASFGGGRIFTGDERYDIWHVSYATGGTHGTAVVLDATLHSSHEGTAVAFMAGARWMSPRPRRARPFVQLLGGGVILPPLPIPIPLMAPGAGVQVRAGPVGLHAEVSLLMVLGASFPRVSTGVVLAWKESRP